MDFSKKLKFLFIIIMIAVIFTLSFMPAAMIYGKTNQDLKLISSNSSTIVINPYAKIISPGITTNATVRW
jgi:hypothetical protein